MPNRKSSGREGSEQVWDLKEIEQLIDLLIQREITEFELEQGGVRVRIKRGNTPAASSTVEHARFASPPAWTPPDVNPTHVAPAPSAKPPSTAAEPPPQESTEGLYIIKSPIVGTFYASPAPNAPPFVKLGDVVEVGQILCIIEAMKLMNDIEAEVSGEVVRIYVESGQPVEYGQSLFAIKASHKK